MTGELTEVIAAIRWATREDVPLRVRRAASSLSYKYDLEP